VSTKFVVEGAKIGCCYAQEEAKKNKKELWDTRILRIYHCNAEKVHGMEVAHNHDCAAIENIPKFGKCTSPYYYDAVKLLSALYPDNKDYLRGYESIKRIREEARELSKEYPPCVLALLDTWFDYSDVEVSEKYQMFIKYTKNFKYDMAKKLENIYKWSKSTIYSKRKESEKYITADPSDASPARKVSENQRREDIVTVDKLWKAEHALKKIYNQGKDKIKRWENYLDEVQIYEGNYAESLNKLASEMESYSQEWISLIESVGISTANEKVKSFTDYCSQIITMAEKLGQDMENWQDVSYALLTSSYLICKCGGKIEFLSNGQENILYCNNLLTEFIKLLKNGANYLQQVLDNNSVYMGAESKEENDLSVKSARTSLLNVVNSFNENKDFLLDENTKSIQIRFITRGCNEEKEVKANALIGIMFFTPASLYASTGGGFLLSFGILTFDMASIGSQDPKDQKKNEIGDGTTTLLDLGSYFTGIGGILLEPKTVTHMLGEKPVNMTKMTGKGITILSCIISLTKLFYTSEEDWIEEIEITVFTDYFAHIISQKYNQDTTPQSEFNGISMVRAKSRKDYVCDTMGNVKWDEMEGVTAGVDNGGNKQQMQVQSPEEMQNTLKNQTMGGS